MARLQTDGADHAVVIEPEKSLSIIGILIRITVSGRIFVTVVVGISDDVCHQLQILGRITSDSPCPKFEDNSVIKQYLEFNWICFKFYYSINSLHFNRLLLYKIASSTTLAILRFK